MSKTITNVSVHTPITVILQQIDSNSLLLRGDIYLINFFICE